MCVFSPLREGRLGTIGLGAKGFALHTLRDSLALLEKQQGCSVRRFPGLFYRQREKSAHLRRHLLTILYFIIGDTPQRDKRE